MKKGFTLTEILVALAVIGVVAAISIPTLLQNTKDGEYKTAWKKAYSELEGVTNIIMQENAGSFINMFSSNDDIRNIYNEKMNVISTCTTSDTVGKCWHAGSKWYYLNGSATGGGNYPGLVLSNGTLLRFLSYTVNCSTGAIGECGRITVDVNGFKGPNKIAKDIYYAHITNDGLIPMGTISGYSCDTVQGFGCSAEYLYK